MIPSRITLSLPPEMFAFQDVPGKQSSTIEDPPTLHTQENEEWQTDELTIHVQSQSPLSVMQTQPQGLTSLTQTQFDHDDLSIVLTGLNKKKTSSPFMLSRKGLLILLASLLIFGSTASFFLLMMRDQQGFHTSNKSTYVNIATDVDQQANVTAIATGRGDLTPGGTPISPASATVTTTLNSGFVSSTQATSTTATNTVTGLTSTPSTSTPTSILSLQSTGTPVSNPTVKPTSISTAAPTPTATPIPVSTPTPMPPVTYAVASTSTLGGGASIAPCSGCSGGKMVDHIGVDTTGSGRSNGTLTFNVNVSTASTYTLTIYYINGSPQRTGYLSINQGSGSAINFPGTGAGVWAVSSGASISVTVTLVQGHNTLEFYNNTTAAPNFDKITVSAG